MIFTKHRFEIWGQTQHPFRHALTDFSFTHNSLPGITNVETAMNWILAVLYPVTKAPVATPAALPSVGNTLNDYRVVTDDGDGKAAGYRWEQREGEAVASWHKLYDMDWGEGSVLANFLTKTQDVYVFRYGLDDRNAAGAVITGDLAGQTIFGGASASTNLTLKANAGDGVGAQTGYVQVVDHFRPVGNTLWDIGTNSYKFRTGYFGTSALVSTLTLETGSIKDSTGAISFDNENLSTSGTLGCGVLTAALNSIIGTTTFASGSITDSTGSISFSNENLSTSGTLGCGVLTITDSTQTLTFDPQITGDKAQITASRGIINFDNENLEGTGDLGFVNAVFTTVKGGNLKFTTNILSSENTDGNITLTPNGSGLVDVTKALQTVGITATGTLGVTGIINIDNLQLDGNTLASTNTNGLIIIDPAGSGTIEIGSLFYPATTASFDFGKTNYIWKDLYFSGSFINATQTFLNAELMSLRNVGFRDATRLSAVQAGDTLFWDAVSGTWLASHPDAEITHSELTGVTTTDAGHTQFVMLAGRAGGQSIQGGTAASNLLILESTTNGTKGSVQTKDSFLPYTNAAYSGGWTGANLGGASNNFLDVYSKGQYFGFRLENVTTGTLPSYSATTPGRLLWNATNAKIYVDTGAAVKTITGLSFVTDTSWNGSDLTKAISITGIEDARNAIWQLKDNTNSYEIIHAQITHTGAANVTITTEIALPAGSYRLIGIEL